MQYGGRMLMWGGSHLGMGVPSWWRDSHLGREGFPVQHGGPSPMWGILAWGGDPIPVYGSQPGMGHSAQRGGSHLGVGGPNVKVLSQCGGPSPAWGISMWGSHLRIGVSHPSVGRSQHFMGVSSLAWGSQCNVTPGFFQ